MYAAVVDVGVGIGPVGVGSGYALARVRLLGTTICADGGRRNEDGLQSRLRPCRIVTKEREI